MIYWSKRRTLKSLGVVVQARDLTEYESTVLEFCEVKYSHLVEKRRSKK